MKSREDGIAASCMRRMLKRIWGALPIVVMIVLILVLGQMIAAKTEQHDALRQGLLHLEARKLAIENRGRVVEIMAAAQDGNAAVEKLAETFPIDSDQAKIISHMQFSSMTGDEAERLERQIAYVKEQIEAGKVGIDPARPDVNVVTMELIPETVRDRINLPGAIEPWVEYNIVAEVRGEVVEKRIEKGVAVSKGEVVAVLDKRDYQIALEAARASYDTALAAKRRLEKLYKDRFVSQSQLDEITAQLERAKAEMNKTALSLKRCTITSPIAGIINNVYIEEGQYANIGDPIAEIMQVDRVKVSVGIPESDVSAVSWVKSFDVSIDALGGKVFAAEKSFLSLSSDPAARLYSLELAVENPQRQILPDMFARVDIVKREIQDAIMVPLYSVVTLDGRGMVYVVNDDVAHARPVQTGIQQGSRIQVTEGLSPGDRLIVVGHRRVSDGQEVNVTRAVSDAEELR